MAKRFFKLIYIFALVALGLSFPVRLFTLDFDRIIDVSYQARCLSNNQYVVLQGSNLNDAYVFSKSSFSSELDEERSLNFYCQYYDDIQPYIFEYISSKTRNDKINANLRFFRFKDSMISNVDYYPPLYQLEVIDKQFQPYHLFSPIFGWFVSVTLLFLLLQFLRMCYVYIVFGKVVWHPFKTKK